MEALKASSFFTFHLSTIPNRSQTTPFKKPIFSFPLTQKPNSSFSLISQNKSKFELSSTSPTISTEIRAEEEEKEEEEKFDWFSQWYPIAAVCDLDKRVPHARRVMGLDIVVWWDRNEGTWKVFDDSCPHRLAPLSEGRIDQWGRLQCVYHGWCFNGSGDCKLIPQAPPDGPPVHTFKKACATVYPSFEQYNIVWFWPRSEPQYKDIAMKETPPYLSELDDPSYTYEMMSRDLPYGYEVLMENLMDPAHVPYAHYGIFKQSAKSRDKSDREGGKPLEINVTKLDKNGYFATRYNGYNKFVPPCLLYFFPELMSGDEPSTSASVEKKTSTQQRMLLVSYCVPVSPGKSRIIMSFPRNFGVWIDRVVPRWIFHIQANLVLDSDLYLVHLEERKLIDAGHWHKACFVPTTSDALIVAFRKWLRDYAGGQIPWGNKFSAEPLLTPPKEQLMDRYMSHVVNCSSCSLAVNRLKSLEVALQVISIASVGIVAIRQATMSVAAKTSVVSFAVFCFVASKWLSNFIYKIFYFHDYNHALK